MYVFCYKNPVIIKKNLSNIKMYYTKIKVYDRHRGEVRVQGIKRKIYISNDKEQLAHAFLK